MAGKKISRIINRSLFNSIFNTLFLSRRVFLKTDRETFPVTFLNYYSGVTTLSIPSGHASFDHAIVFVERGKDIIFANLSLRGEAGKDTWQFETIDIQVVEFVNGESKTEGVNQRAESRIGQVYVSSLVSDFGIEESLKSSSRKLEFLRDEINAKMKDLYESASTVFMHERKPNPRMEHFRRDGKPYFIPEIRSPIRSDEKELAFYMAEIYARDYTVAENRFASEICVPLLYKLMLPVGYLQVNSKTPLTEKDYFAVRKLGMSASTVISNSTTVIRGVEELLPASDVSQGGMSVVFREKTMLRHFKEKSSVVFDVILPGNKKASMMSVVRNIVMGENQIYRVGCEIANIDPIGEVNYGEFLAMLTM